MNITSDLLRTLRVEIREALVAVGAKHGVVLDLGNSTYAALNASFKLTVCVVENGVAVTKEEAFLRQNLRMLGLKEDHLTQVFSVGGHSYTLAGFKNTGSSRPYLVRRLDDTRIFLMPADQLKRALGLEVSSVLG